tara:strand:- start:165 stop:914 length:750 start_codon:yes stop_codon:yes gene_type:complete
MPFSGGGGGALPAHVHNSVPLQGGPLDFANDTIASLNAGSTTYSDGAALQELVIGNAGDSMVVNGAGTAPEWGGASGAWASEGNDINTVKGATLDVTVSDADVYQVLYNVADGGDEPTPALVMRLNDDTGANYDMIKLWGAAAGADADNPTSKTKWLLTPDGSEDGYNGCAYVYKSNSNFVAGARGGATLISQTQQISSTSSLYALNVVGTNTNLTGAITKITLKVMKANTEDDSQIVGSMRVNSLSYS